ncbi:hypothetical protein MNEG_9469 [Monoraphidium neglectum]|uniref:Uncharacterized protein n=1 Tax=Monoraphidium neglectum TaxID=145388 RepID=A0A0D2MVY6_9CHLO|nr:hypothetical protein MNEG_9469 [Monoraphidium neglectum]KIY98495.1 hypothetical protein MNEG_9469 [Monoraphidium neglectum]|eukprot:XP_013897515.1 hypothetical protein MNEG_9469 [Monoraphidium neglectum]
MVFASTKPQIAPCDPTAPLAPAGPSNPAEREAGHAADSAGGGGGPATAAAGAGGGVAATAAAAADDALEESHWELVLESTKLTRMQALLLLTLLRHHGSKLADLAAERARLSLQLQSSTALPPAGMFARGDASLRQVALVEALGANVRRERTAAMVGMQVLRAVLAPAQWATWMALSPSWPPGAAKCGAALERALARGPEAFATSAV